MNRSSIYATLRSQLVEDSRRSFTRAMRRATSWRKSSLRRSVVKRSLQDVPVSVTAFDAVAIRQAGIRNTADFLAMTPNVSFDQSFTVGNSFMTMRGIEQINNADSPVAVVVDGVPQGNQKQLKMELFDVERIEVLEGPKVRCMAATPLAAQSISSPSSRPMTSPGSRRSAAGSGGSEKVSSRFPAPSSPTSYYFVSAANTRTSDGQINNST